MYLDASSPMLICLQVFLLDINSAMLIHLTFKFYLVGMLDMNFIVRDSGSRDCDDLLLIHFFTCLTLLSIFLLLSQVCMPGGLGNRQTPRSLDPINVSKITVAFEAAAPFIASLVNKYFEECIFVTSEKVALLRPLLKKPGLDVEDMNSFRPVSNLSFLSKIVERAMLDQLLPFLEENKITLKNQSAYRQFHSTEAALCKIHNNLVTNACSEKASLLVLLDLSAAFDTGS